MIDFLGIGAQKAGTTWLYRQLDRHPEIAFPAGKEVHYWDSNPKADPRTYLSLFAGSRPGQRRGEITPAYATLDESTIRSIHMAAPQLKILFVLRNPIERAWSSALMALKRAEMKFHEASDQWFLDHFRSEGSRERGDYETTLRRWRSVFPDHQIAVFRYEQICSEPLALLVRCARHIGVDPSHFEAMPKTLLTERVFAGPALGIGPALEEELLRMYRPAILSLERYLAWDLSDWLKPRPARR